MIEGLLLLMELVLFGLLLLGLRRISSRKAHTDLGFFAYHEVGPGEIPSAEQGS